MKVSADGGAPETLTTKAEDEIRHRWPQFLPDGNTILFTVESTTGYRPALASLATGDYRILEDAGLGRRARFLSSGHIAFAEQGAIYAFGFDPDRLVVEGRPVPVHDGVYTSAISGLPYFTASDKSLAYMSDFGEGYERQLLRVDRSGDSVPLIAEKGYFRNLRFSPDGAKLATAVRSETGQDVWIYDLATGARDRMTSTGLNNGPVWAPDGTQIAFAQDFVKILLRSVGTDRDELLHESAHAMFLSDWTPDGTTLAFYEFHPETGADIWMVSRQGDAKPWMVTEAQETVPRFSPDGRFIAWASDETGRSEIYVQPYPGPGEKVPISSGGGDAPVWSPDGRELFYRNGNALMVVDVDTEPTFTPSRPRELLTGSYDVSDLGQLRRVPGRAVLRDGRKRDRPRSCGRALRHRQLERRARAFGPEGQLA